MISHKLSSIISCNQLLLKLQHLAVGLQIEMFLVGGAVRDLLLGKEKWDRDLDFELHFQSIDSEKKALTLFVQALQKTFREGEIEQLPFSIIRLTIADQQLEFSLPREEFFTTGDKCLKHSDFQYSITTNNRVEKSFKRRDFTCNAIALLINALPAVTLIDPFNGQKNMRQKELRHCSQQCFYDPVRFVRLVRFAISLNFSIHPDLRQNLGEFCLQHLTSFYLISEMNKSRCPAKFVTLFFELIDQYNIKLSEQLEFFRPWAKLDLRAVNARQLFVLDLLSTPSTQHSRIEEFFTYAHWLNLKKKFVARVIRAKQQYSITSCNLKDKLSMHSEIVELLGLYF